MYTDTVHLSTLCVHHWRFLEGGWGSTREVWVMELERGGAVEETGFKAFLAELEEDIVNRAEAIDAEAAEPRDQILARVFLEHLEAEGVTTEAGLCPHRDEMGRRRSAITAVSVSEDESRVD